MTVATVCETIWSLVADVVSYCFGHLFDVINTHIDAVIPATDDHPPPSVLWNAAMVLRYFAAYFSFHSVSMFSMSIPFGEKKGDLRYKGLSEAVW